jgi:hypothetical protein
MMKRKKMLLAGVLGVLTGLAVTIPTVQANHVRMEILAPPPDAPSLTAAETLQVDEIKAQQVRARTIYANKIDADQVQGLIHQTGGIQIRNFHSQIKAPEVTASVIYADSISANSVVADAIYVRDLRLK